MLRYRLRSLLGLLFAAAIISWIARFHTGLAVAISLCAGVGGLLGSWTVGHLSGFIGGAVCSPLGTLAGIAFAYFVDVALPGIASLLLWPALVTGGMLGGALGGIFTRPKAATISTSALRLDQHLEQFERRF